MSAENLSDTNGIAIIGMAGRFPGAKNVARFWENQRNGVESISHFTAAELEVPDAENLVRNPAYVPARSVLEEVDRFDAAFFGVYPKEAEVMDPQHRVFLECCWEAIEDAGYDPLNCPGLVGVYAGCAPSTYFIRNVCTDRAFVDNYLGGYQVERYPITLGSNGDFLATRVSYKLNLKGPSHTLLSACSTSLVAICQACQALQSYQCDAALAGGVSITFPQKRGAVYQDGAMISPDGHCRAFDEKANGTVFGSGSGVVLLKRLEDALADGDPVYAVIRGYAVNNDGAGKVGYTAPSVEGQANVIAMAHASADVDPATITYIEAHGTGTPLGDPIEVAALTQAFRAKTDARGFCALGTAKANVGHLDIASGVTGLIRAALAVRDGVLPPLLHFERPNPKLNLENSPFYINNQLRDWKPECGIRRAGVSAFGVGGTNAHVVLEQAPPLTMRPAGRKTQTLVLSAKSPEALDQAAAGLADHLESHPDLQLADVAYTLQDGRHHFDHRRMLVAADSAEAVQILRGAATQKAFSSSRQFRNPATCFLFPGQGSQYPGMARGLYAAIKPFRQVVDHCASLLVPHLGFDLRGVLFPADASDSGAAQTLKRTECAQSAIFTIEYALAQLWKSCGVEPRVMLGHSVGEFVAACLAGVFSLEDALYLVAARGRMMGELPAGGMLSIRLPETAVLPLLNGKLSLAAINSPSLSVISGPFDAIEETEKLLDEQSVAYRRLDTSHAFHSAMMDPAIGPLTAEVKRIRLSSPQIPYVSAVTGNWITADQATDPKYWGEHMRKPVLFSKAVTELMRTPEAILLEVGPGNSLTTLARQHASKSGMHDVISSMPAVSASQSDLHTLHSALGLLWLAGVRPEWRQLDGEERPRKISLSTYPFERKRYWIDAPHFSSNTLSSRGEGLVPVEPSDRRTLSGDEDASSRMVVTMPQTQSIQPDRRTRIQVTLTQLVEELSGTDLANVVPETSFLDIGFDSLFLTQVTQSIQKQFGVRITFRQLLDQESSLDALSAFIDRKLPADAFPAAPAIAQNQPPVASARAPLPLSMPSIPPASGQGALDSTAERIVREQLQAMTQLMAQQLEMLRGGGTPGPAAAAVAAPSPPAIAAVSAPPPPSAVPPAEAEPSRQEFKPFGPYKPVQRGTTGDLTPLQGQHLAALIERYTRRTAGSKQATQDYRKVLADPRVVSGFRAQWKEIVYPIVTVRSRGSRLWDVDGNEYIDILNGFGPTVFGHLPEFVTRAVLHQLEQGIEIGPQSPLAGKVAQMISELTGMERATFCNTGSEAVMAAIRIARTVTGRQKIVLFAGSYHGTFDEVLVKGLKTKSGALRSSPIAPGIPQEKVDNVYVLEYGAPESLEFIRAHAHELAAVLVEPVQSRHLELQPVEFCREIRRITKASETALVFDEVVTGFRVHPGGIQALWNIRADLATYGKVLGGGLPIGVLAGSAEYMDALDGGTWNYGDQSSPEKGVTFFAGTFVRHPLALAACHSVLTYLKEQGPALQERLNARTAALAKTLNEFFVQNSVPTHIQTFGSVFYFIFPAEQRFGTLFYYHLREKGVHIQEGFPCFLTTSHSDADIEQIIRCFKESVFEMQAAGFLLAPGAPVEAAVSTSNPAPAAMPALSEPREAPLSESQLEVLLSAQMGPEASCCFNESISVHLAGDLDVVALRGALDRLLHRHEALRATFSPHGEFQRFPASIPVNLEAVDLSTVRPGARAEQLKQFLATDSCTPFDLVQGPPVRMKLVKLEPKSHVLLFSVHHIVCDGWSTNILLDELSKIYTALRTGGSGELPAPMSFEAFTKSQASHFESAAGAEIEAYWVSQFKDPAPLLDLPLDRPRPSIKSYDGATYRRQIPVAAYQAIKKAGSQQKCTLFVTLLAGFQALLSRLSGQDDIVVGIPAAGQSLLEEETLVGHCVNFLPLRARFAGDPTLAEYLGQVRRTVLDAYDHQNYTYGRLIRKLSIPRDPSRLPLMEVQFNLERVGAGMDFSGLRVDVDPNPKAFVNHDLFLNVIESENGLVLDCDYNTRLFDQETIHRWLGHYITLLGSLPANMDLPVSSLPVLSAAEREQLVVEWNQTAAAFPKDRCIHQLLEDQASQTPSAIAAIYEDQQLTYSELNRKSNQLARHLIKLGVKPGVLVGLFVDRSLEMIVGLLGILKAGGAYVPMDPTYPTDRIAFVVEDAGVSLVLTHEKLVQNLPKTVAQLVYLDTNWAAIERESGDAPTAAVDAEDLAYVIYTSGSTGKPKGVEISHRAVVNLLTSMSKTPGLTAQDTLLAVTTLSFDIAGLELYLPLSVGAKLVIASRESAADGALLLALLNATRTTVIQATPITFRLLLEAGWNGDPKLKVLCGGEAFPRELADQLLPRTTSLWNMYGPTETTIWSSTVQVRAGEGSVPIGPPIDNTQFHVLTANGQLAPIGVPGELHIGGDGLARGYFHRPELTAEKFIANPFGTEPGSRLYKTGDLVRGLPDGSFEFLSRMDNQVKLRGFRIELGEIEAALARYPGLREVVVLLREDIPNDKRLVAYVSTDQQNVTVTAVREFLTGKLPNYMLPAALVRLASMPLTPNGKVDRRALPAPDIAHNTREREFVAPRDAQEKTMADIWAEVLRLELVGVQDNLFELGADSLHIFQIAARANKAGIKVAPAQFLRYRTIESLLEQVKAGAGSDAKAAAPIVRVSREKYRVKQPSV